MKKKVLVRGPLLSQSGYGNHSRQIFRWLSQKEDVEVVTQVLSWGITPWLIDKDSEEGMVGEIMNRSSTTIPRDIDVSYQIQLPNEWDPRIAKKNVGVTAAVETDICNPVWIENCNQMDSVVVPSNFTRGTLERSGECKTPITVIPESFFDEIITEDRILELDLKTDFNFLVFGMLTGQNPKSDRKNLFFTLKWLLEEFANEEDVGIILKTSSGRATKIDRKVTDKIVRQVVKEVRKGPYPRVNFLHGNMTNSEVAGLYKNPKIKALVSLTRGEGYGLPILEAAASDLPVVVTDWSGHLDFLRKGRYVGIDYTMQRIDPSRVDGSIFMETARWAEPSEKDSKKRLRKLYESYAKPKEWADDLGKKLRTHLSHDKIVAHWEKHYMGLFDQK